MNSTYKFLSTFALLVIAACAVYFIINCCMPGGGPTPAKAPQVISGGTPTIQNATLFSSVPFALTPNFPAAGLGEKSVQMRMPAGTASKLRVTLTSAAPPTGGQLTVTVRVNGVNTPLTCQLSGPGDCDSGAATAALADDDRLAVMISNNFAGTTPPTDMVVHWTLLYH